MIRIFNTTYFNRDHYGTHGLGLFHLDVESNRKSYTPLFDDVCKFVYYNDVFKQFGISLTDIYTCMSYEMYEHFKEFVVSANSKKVKDMNEMQTQMDQRQERLMKGVSKND